MPKTKTGLFAGLAALLLAGCGGSNESIPAVNAAPIANAGAAQTVSSAATVTLDGSGSHDSDSGYITTYQWTQTGGTTVALSNTAAARPTFTAPTVTIATPLTFSLVVTDGGGATSMASTVTITVSASATAVTVTGLVRYARAPFLSGYPYGLDYANPVMQPARGVVVLALDAGTQAQLANAETTASGTYSLAVPGNTSIIIKVVARLQHGGAQSLPSWDVRVQNGADPTATATGPYFFSTAAFNSSATAQDIDIPLNIGANGLATGTRFSGPFAIVDTIYQAIQTVLTVSPNVNLPALYVDWGFDNIGTFFTNDSTGQHIALMSDLTEDTDEFDDHVIAHEYGHYIENNFSRSDNIGGSHSYGDRLDPRVAWAEGWATAFGAIALNDPVYRDSFVQNGGSVAGGFNVENNPATIPPAAVGDGLGCWCSESSVWSLVWDLYDGGADANDNVALGFAPLWAALTGAERITPAFTTIFSFIDALKSAQPAQAAAINALVAAQNIDAPSLDAFATGETHVPLNPSTSVPIPNLLPVYTDIVRGTPVIVRSVNDAGLDNKVGNHRFLRYVAQNSGTVNVTVATSNQNGGDPDFLVYKTGTVVADAEGDSSSVHTETVSVPVTAGSTYVIDAYDCANGCALADGDAPQGTPGDYDLTVSIN